MRFSKYRYLFLVAFGLLVAVGNMACEPSPDDVDNEETVDDGGMITVGVINYRPPTEPVLDGFKVGMEAFGYEEGRNIRYIYEGSVADLEGLAAVAEGFVEDDVDLILAIASVSASAAQTATLDSDIPVVFGPVTDPLGSGLVESLDSPGANVTGVTNGGSESRRLEWLLELTPGEGEQVYVPYNPEDPSPRAALVDAEEAAAELGVELILQPASTDAAMETAVSGIPAEADAIFMLPDSLALAYTDEFVAAAIERGLPLSTPTAQQVTQGALVSFGIDLFEVGQQAARLADQILRGQNPAELPVEEAEFFLTINLKTAEAIGLEIPNEILSQASELIRE